MRADVVVRPAVPDARYYREQAERFDRVADQCSIAELIPYYRKMAFDYLARAVRAEAVSAKPSRHRPSHRKRAAQA
jgi:DICT domain-containing protein